MEHAFHPRLEQTSSKSCYFKKDNASIHFNGSPVACIIIQKPLVLILDDKLNSSHHVKEKLPQAIKEFNFSEKNQ